MRNVLVHEQPDVYVIADIRIWCTCNGYGCKVFAAIAEFTSLTHYREFLHFAANCRKFDSFLLHEAMLAQYMLSCVCPSIRHMLVLHQNG